MLTKSVPLFPLPNVVLFPDTIIPLHVFEPRYKQMVKDAQSGDKNIGMILLKPGWEENYEGNPKIYDIGCAGRIESIEELEDGKYNIILKGVNRFHINEIVDPTPYRTARVAMLDDDIQNVDINDSLSLKGKLSEVAHAIPEFFVYNKFPLNRVPVDFNAPLATVIDTLAYFLMIEPHDKQSILEILDVRERADILYEKMVSILQFKTAMSNTETHPDKPELN